MSKAKLFRGLVFLITLVLISQFALAIGLSPAKKIIEFAPNEKQSVMFSIYNNEKKDFTALVSLRGELSQYAKTKDFIVKVNAHDQFKELTFDLELPALIDKPGLHEAEIVVSEAPKEISAGEDVLFVKAVPAVIAKLLLRVPFPSKYAESKLIIEEAKVSENVKFEMPIFNYGKEKILSATATMQIFDNDRKIAEFKSNEISIEPKGQGILSASWKADVSPGTYKVVALIDYDDNVLKLENDFSVGNLIVEIAKLDIGKFGLGDIAKFDVYLESKWNKPIENVYGEMGVSDKKGDVIADIKTASINIEPLSVGKIKFFWDTKGVSIGAYDVQMKIHYAGKIIEKSFPINVNIDSITAEPGLTGQVIGRKGFGREGVLLIVVIVLVLINIGWFIYMKGSKKSRE